MAVHDPVTFFKLAKFNHNVPSIGCAGPELPPRASVCFGKFIDRKSIKRDLEFILYYHLTVVKLVARLLFFIFFFLAKLVIGLLQFAYQLDPGSQPDQI